MFTFRSADHILLTYAHCDESHVSGFAMMALTTTEANHALTDDGQVNRTALLHPNAIHAVRGSARLA